MAAVFPGFPQFQEASAHRVRGAPAEETWPRRARDGCEAVPGTAEPTGGGAYLVDQYGHGVLAEELGLGAFEYRLAEATGCRVPARGTLFDSALGLALRRWCPPLLGLEPHSAPARYMARRRELGAYAAARALLFGSGIQCFLASDDGGEQSYGSGELAALARRPVRKTVALEPLAERVADVSDSVRAFVYGTAEALHGAAREAAAFVCTAEFREPGPPVLPEVHRAADRWLRARERAGSLSPASLRAEPALVRHLLWSALVTGLPLQLRCGDPMPLAGFLGAGAGPGRAVVLLTRPPHRPAAARLAAAFPHVYADAGPRPVETLAEAPFGKLLFSTGAGTLPELYVLRARSFAVELHRSLAGWVADGRCGGADARRIARLIAGDNARGLYGLAGEAVAG